jgi:hypothetical protein
MRNAEDSALEPRFVAVHNALAAMGLAQVGPIQQGILGESRETRVAMPLPAGCVTVVAIGGDGIRDVDATLFDPKGAPIAHDTTSEPQAVLRACLDATETYVLVLRVVSGAGRWVVASWAGSVPNGGPAPSGPTAAMAPQANGTCEAPIPLSPGTVTGSTTRGEHENTGSCSPGDSRELVYELDVATRQRVAIEVEAHFDSVLYIRKDDCADASAEVDCNDDAQDNRSRSRIERVLEPGKYFVFVDGYNREAGAFKMTVTATDVLALADVCPRARALPPRVTESAITDGTIAEATCGGGAEGSEGVWRVQLASRSRVRIVEHSDDFAPVVHARRVCADDRSETACSESGAAAGDATLTGIWNSGSYAVFADAHERDATGRYTVLLETAPLDGVGTDADGCGDAAPLPPDSSGTISGDTFAARDDIASACGGAGAADIVYRLEVPRLSRFVASLDDEEGPHVLVVSRRCGERSAETACGHSIDEILAPGTYFVGVDGALADAFGRFTLRWGLRDLSGQGAACAGAPTLVDHVAMTGTTSSIGDRFATSCGGNGMGGSGPDRVFKLVLTRKTTARVVVTASFDAAIALRRSCRDGAGGLAQPEIACEAEADGAHHVTLDRSLEAGTYWIVVEGQAPSDQGPFTIEYRSGR